LPSITRPFAQYHQTICAVKSYSCAPAGYNIPNFISYIYISQRPFTTWNASRVVWPHDCANACALKQIFAQWKFFLVVPLPLC